MKVEGRFPVCVRSAREVGDGEIRNAKAAWSGPGFG